MWALSAESHLSYYMNGRVIGGADCKFVCCNVCYDMIGPWKC